MAVSLLTGALTMEVSLPAAAQMPQWLFQGQLVDFRNTNPGQPGSSLPFLNGTSATYTGNGGSPTRYEATPMYQPCFDYAGELLFYADGSDLRMADGTVILDGASNPVFDNAIGGSYDLEIIPKPGSCTVYYLAYYRFVNSTAMMEAVYREIDVSTWTVDQITVLDNTETIGGSFSSLATGPLRNDGTRRLYTVGAEGNVQAFDVDERMIGNGSIAGYGRPVLPSLPLPPNNDVITAPVTGGVVDAEVFDNGSNNSYLAYGISDYFAQAGPATLVYVVLDANGDLAVDYAAVPPQVPVYPFYPVATAETPSVTTGRVNGVEFDPDAAGEVVLFTAGEDNTTDGGIYRANFEDVKTNTLPQPITPVTPYYSSQTGDDAYAQSDLEIGFDGRVYVAGTDHLRTLNIPLASSTQPAALQAQLDDITPTLIPASSSSNPTTFRALPSQISSPDNFRRYDYVPISGPNIVNTYYSSATLTFTTEPAPGWTSTGWSNDRTMHTSMVTTYSFTIPQHSTPALYTITLIINTPCGSQTVTKSVSVLDEITGTGCTYCDRTAANGPAPVVAPLAVYPNPAAEEVTVTGLTEATSATLLHLVSGQQVRVALTPERPTLPVAKLAAGLYLLEVRRANGDVLRERLAIVH